MQKLELWQNAHWGQVCNQANAQNICNAFIGLVSQHSLFCSILLKKMKAESPCCTMTSHHSTHKWNHRSGGLSRPYDSPAVCLCAQVECTSVALGTAGEMPTEGFERHCKLVMLGLVLVPATFMLCVQGKQIQKNVTEAWKIQFLCHWPQGRHPPDSSPGFTIATFAWAVKPVFAMRGQHNPEQVKCEKTFNLYMIMT